MSARAKRDRLKAYLEIKRLLGNMGKSMDDYDRMPRINTDDVDDGEVIDRAREKVKFYESYDLIKKERDQKKLLDELIRVSRGRRCKKGG
jgi:hypothetical protein